jgi:hypothetical protein
MCGKDVCYVVDGECMADFGLNTEFVRGEMVVPACVTSEYFAPEVFLGE